MAQIASFRAVVDTTNVLENAPPSPGKGTPHTNISGFSAFLIWRGAYWTKSISWSNKLLIPMYWVKTFFFGRDVSRF